MSLNLLLCNMSRHGKWRLTFGGYTLSMRKYGTPFLGIQMERQRVGDESGWYWNLEKAPRLSAVLSAVVDLAIGERECVLSDGCLSTSVPLPYSKTFLHPATRRHSHRVDRYALPTIHATFIAGDSKGVDDVLKTDDNIQYLNLESVWQLFPLFNTNVLLSLYISCAPWIGLSYLRCRVIQINQIEPLSEATWYISEVI